jgi:hypothetical protein
MIAYGGWPTYLSHVFVRAGVYRVVRHVPYVLVAVGVAVVVGLVLCGVLVRLVRWALGMKARGRWGRVVR